jgi:hypothetical protein
MSMVLHTDKSSTDSTFPTLTAIPNEIPRIVKSNASALSVGDSLVQIAAMNMLKVNPDELYRIQTCNAVRKGGKKKNGDVVEDKAAPALEWLAEIDDVGSAIEVIACAQTKSLGIFIRAATDAPFDLHKNNDAARLWPLNPATIRLLKEMDPKKLLHDKQSRKDLGKVLANYPSDDSDLDKFSLVPSAEMNGVEKMKKVKILTAALSKSSPLAKRQRQEELDSAIALSKQVKVTRLENGKVAVQFSGFEPLGLSNGVLIAKESPTDGTMEVEEDGDSEPVD